MNKQFDAKVESRAAFIVDLPLKSHVRILHPEHVILTIGSDHMDIGSLCYTQRSKIRKRRSFEPTQVVLSSLVRQRRGKILQLIKAISMMLEGLRPASVSSKTHYFKQFVDWADTHGYTNCLEGANASRIAFRAYCAYAEGLMRRQKITAGSANKMQRHTCELLQLATGMEDLARGVRIIKNTDYLNGGTEPVPDQEFAHMLALSQALFDGICDLVLNNRPFPYKLEMPKSLGWSQSHLWVFPTTVWRLPPHQWGAVRETLGIPSWPYDFENGRLATVDEISNRYASLPSSAARRQKARFSINLAQHRVDEANANSRDRQRVMLGRRAHDAFCWLFHANTGGNVQPIRDLETDGTVDKVVANQGFRELKFRASGKEIPIPIPVSFLSSLRRFMDLRAWLLNGASSPYLFNSFGTTDHRGVAKKISESALQTHHGVLRGIDPKLKKISAKKIRATVDDTLLRRNDAAVVAKVMGHSLQTEQKKYGRGSVVDHRDDMTLLLEKISSAAKKQTVVSARENLGVAAKELEQGGGCAHVGHPVALSDEPALQPNCSGGCWFCGHRMLVADEEDARKVASASFVMEHLILGPQHEEKLRPMIRKCEADLDAIACVPDCRDMVKRVKRDVYKDGNLTSYWAEKYQLFLALGVIV